MNENKRPVVIRRRKVVRAQGGGGWKLALADFMTAMMALFLVLWLLAASSATGLDGISEYFNRPLSVAMAGGDKPTASNSAIPGGGSDPVHEEGEKSRISQRQFNRPAEMQRRFLELRQSIRELLRSRPDLRVLRDQVRVFLLPQGLLIQLADSERRPMYELGSDELAPYMASLLEELAPLLNDMPNRLVISGHTDNIQYRTLDREYSNWELSADRANAARRHLVAAGLHSSKLIRVIGLADGMPMPGSKPDDPVNRRIELVLLDPRAEQRVRAAYDVQRWELADGH